MVNKIWTLSILTKSKQGHLDLVHLEIGTGTGTDKVDDKAACGDKVDDKVEDKVQKDDRMRPCLDFVHLISRFWTLSILTRSRKLAPHAALFGLCPFYFKILDLVHLDKVQKVGACGLVWTLSISFRNKIPPFSWGIKWTGLCPSYSSTRSRQGRMRSMPHGKGMDLVHFRMDKVQTS